jgi:hypothetical protein
MTITGDQEKPTLSLLADSLAVGGVWLLILLFLGRALLPGQVLLPLDILAQEWSLEASTQPTAVHNPLLSDAVNYIFPVKHFAAHAVRAGVLPLWNPYVFTGYPLTYNTQAGLFYPLSLLYYLLPAATAVDATIILQMGLGGLFMYLYLRQLTLQRLAAIAGALLFLFNGLMIVWLEWQVIHAAIIWLPLQLYFVERVVTLAALRAGQPATVWRWPCLWRNLIGAGIAFALPWLGGHWNWALYISLTTTVYLLARFGTLWWATRPRSLRRLYRLSGYPALILGMGVALSLVQVLPAVYYLSQSHRQPLPLATSLSFGLLRRAVVLILPNFFGNPLDQNWWGPDNYAESTFYIGILPLFLALLALRPRRDWPTKFFVLWGGVGLLWALGTPAYGLLYALPAFGGLIPSRAAILVVFALTVLAALGLDRLLIPAATPSVKGEPTGAIAIAVAVTTGLLLLVVAVYGYVYRANVGSIWQYFWPQVALFVLWLLGSILLLLARGREWLKTSSFGWLALFWLAADLITFGYDYNTVAPATALYPPTATTEFLQADQELFRVVTQLEGAAFLPNTLLVPRIASLSGYEPGILGRLVNYMNMAEAGNAVHGKRLLMPARALQSPLLDILNIKYVIGKTQIYLKDNYAPRAFVAPRALIVEGEKAALAALLKHAGQLDQLVVLELAGQAPPPTLGSLAAGPSSVGITRYTLNRVQLRANMAAPGFVVLADSYYPGWLATLDGVTTPLYRANSLLRAVYIPEGEHDLVFVFRPLDFMVGAGVSGLTLLFCLVALAWTYRKSHRA